VAVNGGRMTGRQLRKLIVHAAPGVAPAKALDVVAALLRSPDIDWQAQRELAVRVHHDAADFMVFGSRNFRSWRLDVERS